MWPHKQDVTQVLAYVAQACHEFVPPEALESLLMKIANNFVSERSAPEVMAVGINAIREVCRRCPLAMTEDLLQDLAEYKKYKNKAVMTAAKGLIGTFRELNPTLLKKKDRGRPDDDDGLGESGGAPLAFGEQRPVEFLSGIELLTMAEDEDAERGDGMPGHGEPGAAITSERLAAEDDGWSDGSGGWVNISDDEGGPVAATPDGPVVIDALTAEARRAKAISRMGDRPLTQADFERIKMLQLERKLMPSHSEKRARATDETSAQVLDESALLPLMKKSRQTKAERLAQIKEGREERGKFNIRKGHEGGTTNREKEHRKNPMMIKHKLSMRRKATESATSKVARAQLVKKQFRGKKAR